MKKNHVDMRDYVAQSSAEDLLKSLSSAPSENLSTALKDITIAELIGRLMKRVNTLESEHYPIGIEDLP